MRKTDCTEFKPASDEFKFRDFPFYWLFKLSNRYVLSMETGLKKAGLNHTGWRVCMILKEHGSLSMSDISAHAVAKLPTVTKVVHSMKAKGLVTVGSDKNDGRVTKVEITAKGLETAAQVINSTTRVFDTVYEDLEPKDLSELNRILKVMYQNLSN